MVEVSAVTLVSLLAGFVNSIAGGGGLVSLPILLGLFPSAPPATLFGTNKAAMVWGTGWAAGAYARRVRLPWATLLPALVAAVIGGAAGAWLVTLVSADWLRRLLPALLAAVLVVIVLQPDLGSVHAPRHPGPREAVLATGAAGLLGLYDGFFGPGTGTFFIFFFVRVLGFDFLHAVACAKLLNAATNIASLATFGCTGNVWWQYMLPMAVANVVGSAAGARMALRHGSPFIRGVFVVVVGFLILKAGYDGYSR
jgi:uncharacterized membrane protein YfcA